jgi:hypothetical protein
MTDDLLGFVSTSSNRLAILTTEDLPQLDGLSGQLTNDLEPLDLDDDDLDDDCPVSRI